MFDRLGFYIGEWSDQTKLPSGRGLFISTDNTKHAYLGQIKNGEKQGRGILVLETEKHMGEFISNSLFGFGTTISNDGKIYRGTFENQK